MPGFLDKVLPHKIQEIAERRVSKPLESFQHLISKADGRFLKSIAQASLSIIAEIKPRSPALGKLDGSISLDERIKIYSRRANAISVLCDEKFFDGSIDLLAQVSRQTDLPTLCKDFVVDPYQVYEARYAGAEAVLLICKLLSAESINELYREIKDLGMIAVVEVQNEREMNIAAELGAEVILINNRDLQSLEIDLDTTKRLVNTAPAGAHVITASGVEDAEDFLCLRAYASSFLIGSAFMKSADPEATFFEFYKANRCYQFDKFADLRDGTGAVSDLNTESKAKPAVKICGICNQEDALAAVQFGADFLGLIFAESPRKVDLEQALLIKAAVAGISGLKPKLAGVFRNQPVEEVVPIAESLELDIVQLHGSESPQQCSELKLRLPNLLIVKVIEVDPDSTNSFSVDPSSYLACADAYLFDRPKSLASNSAWLDELCLTMQDQLQAWRPFIIAGGLNEANLEKALKLNASGIDLASGVESSPRQKDHQKMKSFFDRLKGAVKC